MQGITIKLPPVCIRKRNGLECRYIPFSLNKRLHWAVRSKWNVEWKNTTYWEIKRFHKQLGKIPYSFATITITLNTCYPLDRDNAYTACKSVVDGIVLAGVIPDDSDKYLDLKVKVNKVSKLGEQCVEICIVEGGGSDG